MSDKTFLLGLGSQKCGTSWLHQVVATSPHACMGFTKEYHIFDARSVPEMAEHVPSLSNYLRRFGLNPRYNLHILRRAWPTFRRSQFYRDTNLYFDYFDGLLNRRDVRITGDITPAYIALDTATLAHIRDESRRHGWRIRVVMLVRDPVERCWSAVRMARRDARYRNPLRRWNTTEEEDLLELYASKSYRLRTHYHAAFERMKAVFDEDEFLVLMYEDLFQAESVARISQFLELSIRTSDYETRVNASPKRAAISEAARENIAAFYAEEYRFAAAMFSERRVRERWPNAALVLG